MDLVKMGGEFTVTCRDKFGNFKWRDTIKNTVVNEGLAYILERIFRGNESSGEQSVAPWFVGLTASGEGAAATDGIGDVSEFSAYTGTRKEFVETLNVSTPATPTMNNTASKASFTISSDSQTVGGAFLCSVDTGSSGTLLCGGTFTNGDKSDLDTDDTLEVEYVFQCSSS